MIRVATEQELRPYRGRMTWRDRNGGEVPHHPAYLEHGYYVIEVRRMPGAAHESEILRAAEIAVLAPGPYIDRYRAEHVAITVHGMEPDWEDDEQPKRDHIHGLCKHCGALVIWCSGDVPDKDYDDARRKVAESGYLELRYKPGLCRDQVQWGHSEDCPHRPAHEYQHEIEA